MPDEPSLDPEICFEDFRLVLNRSGKAGLEDELEKLHSLPRRSGLPKLEYLTFWAKEPTLS